jgi:hypothetical protein
MVFSTPLSYLGLDPVTVLLVLLGYMVLRSVYRLTLHPLAKFPGPRLAAVSGMYGASYDLPKNSSYVKVMPALHDKYGPLGWLVTAIFHQAEFQQALWFVPGQTDFTSATWIPTTSAYRASNSNFAF